MPANSGDAGSIPGLGRYSGGGHGNPLHAGKSHGQRGEPGGLQSTGS